MAQFPLQALHDQIGAGFNLALVRISRFLHIALGHPVGTEENVGGGRHFRRVDLLADQAHHRLDVARVVIPAANAMDRQLAELRIGLTQPLQLAKAGTAGADGKLRVEGEHHHFIHGIRFDVGHGRLGEGMPIAHGHVGRGFNVALAQQALQFPRLVFGDAPEGGAAANGAIGIL